VYGYGLVVLLMVLIRLASADYLWAGFPNECLSDKRFGCSRIAESNPHGARHLTPLHLAAALPDVQAQAEAWIAASAQVRLLLLLPWLLLTLADAAASPADASPADAAPWAAGSAAASVASAAAAAAVSAQAHLLKDSRPGFLHARYLTWFWGFADDFMVSLRWALLIGESVGWLGGRDAWDGREGGRVRGREGKSGQSRPG
jgi:hypothetical protein